MLIFRIFGKIVIAFCSIFPQCMWRAQIDFTKNTLSKFSFLDNYEDELEDEYMRINIQPLRECHVHLPNGDVFPFTSAWFVIAAGSESGHIANLCGLGIGEFLSD